MPVCICCVRAVILPRFTANTHARTYSRYTRCTRSTHSYFSRSMAYKAYGCRISTERGNRLNRELPRARVMPPSSSASVLVRSCLLITHMSPPYSSSSSFSTSSQTQKRHYCALSHIFHLQLKLASYERHRDLGCSLCGAFYLRV